MRYYTGRAPFEFGSDDALLSSLLLLIFVANFVSVCNILRRCIDVQVNSDACSFTTCKLCLLLRYIEWLFCCDFFVTVYRTCCLYVVVASTF